MDERMFTEEEVIAALNGRFFLARIDVEPGVQSKMQFTAVNFIFKSEAIEDYTYMGSISFAHDFTPGVAPYHLYQGFGNLAYFFNERFTHEGKITDKHAAQHLWQYRHGRLPEAGTDVSAELLALGRLNLTLHPVTPDSENADE